jgi:hypothetical protein
MHAPKVVTGVPVACRLVLGAGTTLAAIALAQGALAQPPPSSTGSYTLVDTWQPYPWTFHAGAYQSPVDAADAPDGRRWLLDRRSDGMGTYVHVFAPDGSPISAFPVKDAPDHLDVDPSDRVFTLQTVAGGPSGKTCWLRGYDPKGVPFLGKSYPIDDWADCVDLSVGADDRLYVVVSPPPPFARPPDASPHLMPSRMLVFSSQGVAVDEVPAEALYPVDHAQPIHMHPVLTAVDVAFDRRIYVGLYFTGCG